MEESPYEILKSSHDPRTENHASKKRKVVQKTVVRMRIEPDAGRQKGEGPPPSDLWSWRKYGQKPIKGSPYPRGYYRCSTSKGCSAKKQVERCRTDSSVLIITYTSSHNHPGPDLQSNLKNPPFQDQLPMKPSSQPTSKKEDFSNPYFQSQETNLQNMTLSDKNDSPLEKSLTYDETPLSSPHLVTFSTPKSEENDFFDELEELPTFSSFARLMKGSFFDERISCSFTC